MRITLGEISNMPRWEVLWIVPDFLYIESSQGILRHSRTCWLMGIAAYWKIILSFKDQIMHISLTELNGRALEIGLET